MMPMMPTAMTTIVAGGLTLRKKCGETFCPNYHMCQDHDSQCYPCMSFCQETSNNFDASICEQQCQDYIHDYVRHYVRHNEIKDTLEKLENMQTWMIVIAVMVFTALIFVSVTLAFIWNRERRIRKIKNGDQDSFFKQKLASLQYVKNRDQVKTVSETVSNRPSMAASATCATSLAATTQTDMHAITSVSSAASSSSAARTNTSSAGGNSTNSSTGSSNKLPCEDATLEFSGYDNFALKVSPVLGGKTASSSVVTSTDLLQQYTP